MTQQPRGCKYDGALHTRPYDLEANTFDRHKTDEDYDDQDLSRLPDSTDDLDPLTLLDLSEFGGQQVLEQSFEFRSDSDDPEDRVSEVGGKSRPNPITRQLVQDAGGYSVEVDPRSQWKTETRHYCRSCGSPIESPRERIECEVQFDPCPTEMLNRGGGCQSCREQRAIDRKEARGRGNPPQTCRPQLGEKESRCGKDWKNRIGRWERAVARAEKSGEEPPPKPRAAEPKLTESDFRRIRDAQLVAEARAEYARRRPPELRRAPTGLWDQPLRGTGFTLRDDLRKPGWR